MKFNRFEQGLLKLERFSTKNYMFILNNGYKGWLDIEGEKVPVMSKDFLIVPSGTRIGLALETNKIDSCIYLFSLSDPYMAILIERLKYINGEESLSISNYAKPSNYIRCEGIYDDLKSLSDGIYIIEKKAKSNRLIESQILNACFLALTLVYQNGLDISLLFKDLNYLSVKQRLIKVILNNPSYKWSLESLSAQLFISRSSLRRKLEAESLSIVDLLNEVRLGLATNYLSFTDFTISNISSLAGFNSPSYFGLVFKKKFGCTPKHFRVNSKAIHNT